MDIKTHQYYAEDRVSNSLLNIVEQEPWKLFEKDPLDKYQTVLYDPYRKGQIIDQLLTANESIDDCVNVLNYPINTLTVTKLVKDHLIDKKPTLLLDDRSKELLFAIEEAINTGKMFCSPTEKKNLLAQIERFKPLRKHYKASKLKEVVFQQIVLWTYKGVLCKSMMDVVLIDHKKKTIELMDIKTTSVWKKTMFEEKIIQYRYHRQAAFYALAFQYYITYTRTELKDYKIVSFSLLVSPNGNLKPFKKNMSDKLLKAGQDGFFYKDVYIPGIDELIEKYKKITLNEVQ